MYSMVDVWIFSHSKTFKKIENQKKIYYILKQWREEEEEKKKVKSLPTKRTNPFETIHPADDGLNCTVAKMY